jgi:hypothetical protein
MDQQTTVAKIFFESKREGTRKIGKPGVKWFEDGGNDLRELKVNKLRQIIDTNERLS